jgi:hypothetical protein
MIGELKSKEVRTVREQKILRVTVDVPLSRAKEQSIEGVDVLPYLDSRVGGLIGFRVHTLEDEGQMTLNLE